VLEQQQPIFGWKLKPVTFTSTSCCATLYLVYPLKQLEAWNCGLLYSIDQIRYPPYSYPSLPEHITHPYRNPNTWSALSFSSRTPLKLNGSPELLIERTIPNAPAPTPPYTTSPSHERTTESHYAQPPARTPATTDAETSPTRPQPG